MKSISQIKQSLDKIGRYTNRNIDKNYQVSELLDQSHIEYKNVCLHINNKIILDNINTSISNGSKIGIVGNSGSGKSSFINLLIGVHNPTQGKILLSGKNIFETRRNLVNDQICYIASNTFLFDRSIYNNIAYGNREVSLDQIHNAAKMVDAHDFIMKMKDGYNTMLSNNGITLSAGQRQRILLARTIIKKSNITILDEATSHIDETNESKILSNLLEVLKGKTLIVISHRLSSLSFTNKILLFENGRIIGEHTHTELTKK
jgi:ATP-binding cassette subfamily B protein